MESGGAEASRIHPPGSGWRMRGAGLGAATECVIDPGRHHFDVIEGLADPASPLMRRLLDYSG